MTGRGARRGKGGWGGAGGRIPIAPQRRSRRVWVRWESAGLWAAPGTRAAAAAAAATAAGAQAAAAGPARAPGRRGSGGTAVPWTFRIRGRTDGPRVLVRVAGVNSRPRASLPPTGAARVPGRRTSAPGQRCRAHRGRARRMLSPPGAIRPRHRPRWVPVGFFTGIYVRKTHIWCHTVGPLTGFCIDSVVVRTFGPPAPALKGLGLRPEPGRCSRRVERSGRSRAQGGCFTLAGVDVDWVLHTFYIVRIFGCHKRRCPDRVERSGRGTAKVGASLWVLHRFCGGPHIRSTFPRPLRSVPHCRTFDWVLHRFLRCPHIWCHTVTLSLLTAFFCFVQVVPARRPGPDEEEYEHRPPDASSPIQLKDLLRSRTGLDALTRFCKVVRARHKLQVGLGRIDLVCGTKSVAQHKLNV
jgi:hypothetical protein